MSQALAKQLPYYHTFVSYDQVRKKFEPYLKKDGYFLLRNSMSGGLLVISVVHNQDIKHMRIEEDKGNYMIQDKSFKTVEELVQHYKKTEIPNDERIRHIKLLYPIANGQQNQTGTSQRPSVGGQSSSQTARSSTGGQSSAQVTRKSAGGQSGAQVTRNNIEGQSKAKIDKPLDFSSSTPKRTNSEPVKKNPFAKQINRPSSAKSPGDIQGRPPAKLPRDPFGTNVPASPSSSLLPPDHCYDYANTSNRLEEVKQNVRRAEAYDSKYCECGLLKKESALPLGWTVHISTEPSTKGRLFFVSASAQSAWNLPTEADSLLTQEQRFFIEGIKQKRESSIP